MLAVAGIILFSGTSTGAFAQTRLDDSSLDLHTSVDRSFAPAPKDCADVQWSQRVLQSYPSIADACQAVEQRNGITYVKLEGIVEKVKNGGKEITVDLKDGKPLTFRPTPHTALYLDGQRTQFADVKDGTKLNFYIPEDRLEAQIQPNPERVAFVIVPIAVPDEAALQRQARAELPQTAGLLPTVGVAGLLLIVVGFAARFTRRRISNN
jgi:hypothetical protein